MKIEKSQNIIKALADGSRIRIMKALLEKPQYVEELSARLNIGAPTISFHLKKLEHAGFVVKNKEQYYMMFSVNKDALSITLHELINVEDGDKEMQDERMIQYRNKVIKTYFKKGMLDHLPSQEKKRKIALEEIAGRFAVNKKYDESEVTKIIEEVYGDYCTIRRELIDRKIMARKGNAYWLTNPIAQKPVIAAAPESKEENRVMDRKKELKMAYKMNPPKGGVFQIKNLVNGKLYVGSWPNIEGRINRDRMILNMNGHVSEKELQEEWNEFGEKNFEFKILDILKRQEDSSDLDYRKELDLLEEMWVEKLQPFGEKGYNRQNAKKTKQ
jgi:DNA-binding HxlR family transcriptional regulator